MPPHFPCVGRELHLVFGSADRVLGRGSRDVRSGNRPEPAGRGRACEALRVCRTGIRRARHGGAGANGVPAGTLRSAAPRRPRRSRSSSACGSPASGLQRSFTTGSYRACETPCIFGPRRGRTATSDGRTGALALAHLHVRPVPASARFRRPTEPVGPEPEAPGTLGAAGRAAVFDEARPRQRAVHLYRYVMRPRVRS